MENEPGGFHFSIFFIFIECQPDSTVRRGRTPGHLLLPFGQFTLPHPTIWRYMTIIPDKNTITRFIPRSFPFSILNSPLLHKKRLETYVSSLLGLAFSPELR